MEEKNFTNMMNKEAKEREKLVNDTIRSLEEMNSKKIEDEKSIQQYKIDEIKYKTTIKELNEYIEMYKNKLSEYENENDKSDNEVISLRKKILKNETDISTLKSILELFVKEYGIKEVVELTKLDKKKIESYLGDE